MSNHAVKSYQHSENVTQCNLSQEFFHHCKTQLKQNLKKIEALCSKVPLPRGKLEYIDYFCGRSGSAEELDATKAKRSDLLKAISDLINSYINIVDEMENEKALD